MSIDRITRVNELLRREIGQVLFGIMNEAGFDLAAVTITHVITSRNLRNARVFVSIRGTDEKKAYMLSRLERHRGEIQARINKDLSLKFTPCLRFEIDDSIEKGDHLLDVLSHLEGGGTAEK